MFQFLVRYVDGHSQAGIMENGNSHMAQFWIVWPRNGGVNQVVSLTVFPAPSGAVDWLSCWVWVFALSVEWLRCLRNTNEQVLDLWCKFKDVLFSALDITLQVSFNNRAISTFFTGRMNDRDGGRITTTRSTRTVDISQSTATSGNLMKILGCEVE